MTDQLQKKIAFYTFGCKLNFSETSYIANILRTSGYKIIPFNQQADYYVINNCTVTREAERKFERIVRSLKTKFPLSKIIAMGCYSEVSADSLSINPLIDLVLGTNQKFDLPKYLNDLELGRIIISEHSFTGNKNEFIHSFSKGDRTRSFLKIQDGCDYFCTYCAIPFARGRSRSDSVQNIVTSVRKIIDEGIKEIVITGVNVGEYKSPEGHSLIDLLKEIDKINDPLRIRISSLEPNLISKELLELFISSKKFMPHFHIPLQSGSDRILKLMNRKYNSIVFINQIETILDLVPDVFIGIDVIAGFPGETDEDFVDTFNILDSLDLAYLHVFPYSERPGTRANAMNLKTDPAIISKRTHELLKLSENKNMGFYRRYISSIREVLFEGIKKDGYYYGHSDNYLKTRVKSEINITNQIKFVRYTDLIPGAVIEAEIIVL